MAVEDKPGIVPGGARAVHVTNKPICRALGWLPTEEEKVSNVLTGNTTRAGCATASRQPSTLSVPSPWNAGNRQHQPYQVHLA